MSHHRCCCDDDTIADELKFHPAFICCPISGRPSLLFIQIKQAEACFSPFVYSSTYDACYRFNPDVIFVACKGDDPPRPGLFCLPEVWTWIGDVQCIDNCSDELCPPCTKATDCCVGPLGNECGFVDPQIERVNSGSVVARTSVTQCCVFDGADCDEYRAWSPTWFPQVGHSGSDGRPGGCGFTSQLGSSEAEFEARACTDSPFTFTHEVFLHVGHNFTGSGSGNLHGGTLALNFGSPSVGPGHVSWSAGDAQVPGFSCSGAMQVATGAIGGKVEFNPLSLANSYTGTIFAAGAGNCVGAALVAGRVNYSGTDWRGEWGFTIVAEINSAGC